MTSKPMVVFGFSSARDVLFAEISRAQKLPIAPEQAEIEETEIEEPEELMPPVPAATPTASVKRKGKTK